MICNCMLIHKVVVVVVVVIIIIIIIIASTSDLQPSTATANQLPDQQWRS